MRSRLAFGVGVIVGAGLAALTIVVSSSRHGQRKDAEPTHLTEELARARQAARHDEEALRAILRERALPREAPSPKVPSSAADAEAMRPSIDSAISNYLGAPVSAPANLDHKYSGEEIMAVFRDLAETLGFKVGEVAVDTTEFPFLIHGRVESAVGGDFFKKINAELRALPGYTYGGSVTGRTRDGATYFALDMTPSSAYPREKGEAIRRRTMLRLQMLAAAWGNSPP